jgi:hypothetical protein
MQTGERLSLVYLPERGGRYLEMLFRVLKIISDNNGKSTLVVLSYIKDYYGDEHICRAILRFFERKGLIKKERDSRKMKIYITDRARWILDNNHNGNDKPVWVRDVLNLTKGLAGAVAFARHKRKIQRKRAKEKPRIMARLLKDKAG